MNSMKAWTITVTFVAIASLLLETLIPSGKLEKIMRLVLNVFMLCSIMFPLKNIVTAVTTFNIEKHDNNYKINEDFKRSVEQQTNKYSEENLKKIVTQILNEKGIFPQKINIFMDTKEDNCILFIKVKVYLNNSDKEKKGEIIELIKKRLNIETVEVLGSD